MINGANNVISVASIHYDTVSESMSIHMVHQGLAMY